MCIKTYISNAWHKKESEQSVNMHRCICIQSEMLKVIADFISVTQIQRNVLECRLKKHTHLVTWNWGYLGKRNKIKKVNKCENLLNLIAHYMSHRQGNLKPHADAERECYSCLIHQDCKGINPIFPASFCLDLTLTSGWVCQCDEIMWSTFPPAVISIMHNTQFNYFHKLADKYMIKH